MASTWQSGPAAECPPPFRLTSPLVLELRQGGGGMAVLGLPFFLAGCLITRNFLRMLFLGELGLRGSLLTFAAIGIAFTVIGTIFVFGGRWLIIDVSRGLLVRRLGLLVPLRTRERSLSEFNAVVLAHDPGDSDRGETYPVRLRSVGGPDFVVRSPARFGESRTLAEYLSAFLRLPLVDTISDHQTVAAPGNTQQTLRERGLTAALTVTQLQPPANLRSRITESGGATTIVIPSAGGLPLHILGIVFPLVVLVVLFPALFRLLGRIVPSPWAAAVLLFTIALLVFPLIFLSVGMMVAGSRKRTTVIASSAGIELEQGRGGSMNKQFVAADDLLDVDSSTVEAAIESILASAPNASVRQTPNFVRWLRTLKKWIPSKGIVIKSRTELITFGQGLPAEELQYLCSVLRRALVGERW